MKNKEITR